MGFSRPWLLRFLRRVQCGWSLVGFADPLFRSFRVIQFLSTHVLCEDGSVVVDVLDLYVKRDVRATRRDVVG